MKIHWITAALLSTALAAACSDRGTETPAITAENGGTAANGAAAGDQFTAAPPAAPASGNRDGSAVQPNSPGTRPATGSGSAAAPARPVAREPREPRAPVAAAPAPPPRPAFRDITVPAGTSLPLELTTSLSTETASVEMPVSARLRQAVIVDGVTVLPAGAVVDGEVTDVERPGRVQGRARLGLRFTSVTVGGARESLRTNPVSFQGEASKGEDATKIGAGAGIGAVIGGIIGGGDGAAKGAAIGGAAGTGAVLATRGKDVSVASGTDVTATLASDVEIRVPNR